MSVLAHVVAFFIGILMAAAAVMWHFAPKWRREEREEADRRVAAIREALAKAHAERAAAAQAAVQSVEAQAAKDRGADTVDTANRFIIDGMKGS